MELVRRHWAAFVRNHLLAGDAMRRETDAPSADFVESMDRLTAWMRESA